MSSFNIRRLDELPIILDPSTLYITKDQEYPGKNYAVLTFTGEDSDVVYTCITASSIQEMINQSSGGGGGGGPGEGSYLPLSDSSGLFITEVDLNFLRGTGYYRGNNLLNSPNGETVTFFIVNQDVDKDREFGVRYQEAIVMHGESSYPMGTKFWRIRYGGEPSTPEEEPDYWSQWTQVADAVEDMKLLPLASCYWVTSSGSDVAPQIPNVQYGELPALVFNQRLTQTKSTARYRNNGIIGRFNTAVTPPSVVICPLDRGETGSESVAPVYGVRIGWQNMHDARFRGGKFKVSLLMMVDKPVGINSASRNSPIFYDLALVSNHSRNPGITQVIPSTSQIISAAVPSVALNGMKISDFAEIKGYLLKADFEVIVPDCQSIEALSVDGAPPLEPDPSLDFWKFGFLAGSSRSLPTGETDSTMTGSAIKYVSITVEQLIYAEPASDGE